MPKIRHEAVVEILQNEPGLVLSLLQCIGLDLGFGSRGTIAIADSNLSDREAADENEHVRGLFSDNVFVFEGDGRRVAVIAEVQTARPDEERSLSWPAYVANARRRNRCDALLMVFAITKDAARGSAEAIHTGHPGWDLIPLISGIGLTPGTPSYDGRFAAELLLLRVITRELTLDTHDARMLALTAIRSAPPERIERYTRYLKALVPASTRGPLETLMKTVLKDDFIDGWIDKGRIEGRVQGRVQGRAEMLLELMEMRFNVPDDIRKRVEGCNDTDQIKAWFKRVPTAASLEDVFA